MNKHLKIFLKILGAIILLCIALVGCFWWSITSKRNSLGKEVAEKMKSCDTIKIITQQPEIKLIGFANEDVKSLKFQIIRDHQLIQDTTTTQYEYISEDGQYRSIKIPYPRFMKSDSIVVTINNKLKYYISDFQFSAHELYGMMGPVAVSDCELVSTYTINGVSNLDSITPTSFMYGKSLQEQAQFLNESDLNFTTSIQNLKINVEQAKKIFDEVKTDKNRQDNFLQGIRKEPHATYYLFKDHISNTSTGQRIVTVNAETGLVKKYDNYPFY